MRRSNNAMRQELNNALDLIAGSVEDEKADALFYEWLLQNIPVKYLTPAQTESIKETIQGIRDDELGHNKTFKTIYKEITGVNTPAPAEENFVAPANFTAGIVKALKGEMEAVKRYRQIISGMPNTYYRDQVFNILSDELRHGTLYNYVYTTIIKNQ